MRKLPLMIIGVSLLFLGLGGIAKQVEKYIGVRSEQSEIITLAPSKEIREESKQFVIVTKRPEDSSQFRINLEPPVPPVAPAPNGETVKEFRLERQPNGEPLKIFTTRNDENENSDFQIYKKEADEAEIKPELKRKEMRIIIKKERKEQ